MEFIKCPKCKGDLKTLEVYGKPEFIEETFQCEKCNKRFRKRIDFKSQTREIVKDEIIEIL